MRFVRSLAIWASIALPLVSVAAQSDSATSATVTPPKWEFSVGADPTNLDLNADPGIKGHFVSTLTRNWQSAQSRYSRRVSLMVGRDYRRYTGGSCYGCRDKAYAAVTAGISADLFHAWKLTPYVQSGAGFYYTHLGPTTSPLGGDGLIPRPATNDFSLGINGGLGIKARFSSHELFIEQTLHAFDVRAFDHGGVYPLSIGIRW